MYPVRLLLRVLGLEVYTFRRIGLCIVVILHRVYSKAI